MTRKGAAEPNEGGHEPLFYTLSKRVMIGIVENRIEHGDGLVEWCIRIFDLSPTRQDGYVVWEYVDQKTINDNEK